MKRVFIFLSLLFIGVAFSSNLTAQEYVKMMNDHSVNFYDVQKKFNEYWAGRTYTKGSGWKQFKRWEDFMSPRVFPSGNRFDKSISYLEYQKYYEKYLNDNNPVFGDWTAMGPTSWTNGNVGYNPGLGRINCILVDPNNANISYVGSPSGGLWKSVNGGANWTALNDRFTVLGVSSIVIHPSNSNVIYIATGDADAGNTYSVGVLKSIDAGVTWTTTGLSFAVNNQVTVTKLLINPNNPNNLLAATSNGIYRTVDAGVTWAQAENGVGYRDLEFKSSDPNTVYASGNIFKRSVDGGVSFNQITSGVPNADVGRIAIGVSPANDNYVYLLVSRETRPQNFIGLYRSVNSGTDFNMMSNTPNILGYDLGLPPDSSGQGDYDLALAVSPTDPNLIFTGGINIWKSANGGTSWTKSTHWAYNNGTLVLPYVHADIHTLDFFGSRLFSGADGGIFVSPNNGANWADISAGMNITQFYAFGFSPANADRIIGGAQDNGVNLLNNGTWTHVYGADGFEGVIDYTNPNVLYFEQQNGSIFKSVDGGATLNASVNGINEEGPWNTRFVIHPTNPQILFAGFTNVWKTVNGAGDWTRLAVMPGFGKVEALEISQSNPDVLYASKEDGTISVTVNGGTSWTDISNGLPALSKTYIAINPTNPNIAFVSLSGFTAGEKIFKTIDAGATWTNITGTLPNLPANCVTFESGPNEGIYVGMDVGVYYKNNQLPDWIPYMDGLPNVIVREIQIHYPSNRVRVATYGRGIWQATIAAINVGVENLSQNTPNNYNLLQNFPNPFNPETQIRYDILKSGFVNLRVYDGLGREVSVIQSGYQNAGSYKADFNGSSLASGTYFYRLEVTNNSDVVYAMTKKMILLK
jgi:hypothetical protein